MQGEIMMRDLKTVEWTAEEICTSNEIVKDNLLNFLSKLHENVTSLIQLLLCVTHFQNFHFITSESLSQTFTPKFFLQPYAPLTFSNIFSTYG